MSEATMMRKIKGYSPLTEVTFYILISLVEPLHGYGIILKVDEMTNGRVKLAAGTLYGALNNLLKNGLIERIGVDPDNPRRIVYQITRLGELLIDHEIDRLKCMVEDGFRERSK